MAPLATVPDLEARIGPLNALQTARAPALLDDASAIVRDDTGQAFEETVGDVIVLRPIGRELLLPSRPVNNINSVTALDCPPGTNLELDQNLFCFDGIDRIRLDAITGYTIESLLLDSYVGTGTFEVDYDHGAANVPAIVVAVVCGMVNRVLTSPSLATGLTQETVGQYGYMTQQSTGTQGTEIMYTMNDRRKLRRYRRTASTIVAKTS